MKGSRVRKSFAWKKDHPTVTWDVKTIFHIETRKEVDENDKYFPLAYTEVKEEDRQIDKYKAPEWMDAKMKIK